MTTSWLARLAHEGKRLLFGRGQRQDTRDRATRLYARAVAQARQPFFYTDFGVPDTHDGRLEVIQLHVILLLRRLQRGDATMRAVGQALFDVMFEDVDDSLREGGVGDLAVGKWIKTIAKQFYARGAAVEGALEQRDAASLGEILSVNVYGDHGEPGRVRALAEYLLATDLALAAALAAADDPLAALQFPAPGTIQHDPATASTS
ncbi:MAG: ubiquinol-cytochrome C chaperone family protein [Pseudomonadota bacterium]